MALLDAQQIRPFPGDPIRRVGVLDHIDGLVLALNLDPPDSGNVPHPEQVAFAKDTGGHRDVGLVLGPIHDRAFEHPLEGFTSIVAEGQPGRVVVRHPNPLIPTAVVEIQVSPTGTISLGMTPSSSKVPGTPREMTGPLLNPRISRGSFRARSMNVVEVFPWGSRPAKYTRTRSGLHRAVGT